MLAGGLIYVSGVDARVSANAIPVFIFSSGWARDHIWGRLSRSHRVSDCK